MEALKLQDSRSVFWSGAVLDPSGYGEATRNYLAQLNAETSINTKLLTKYFWGGSPAGVEGFLPMLERLQETDFNIDVPHVFVQHLTPENYRRSPGNCHWHIGMTTFETDRVPANWMMNMCAMDELWTFSHWGKSVFEKMGIRRPITVIPHGVDPNRFNPNIKPLMARDGKYIDENDYVFGSNFDWTERKNPGALIEAYFRAFKPSDPVKLIIKAYYQFPYEKSAQYITNYINGVKRRMGLDETPKIVLLTDIIGADKLPGFYTSLDAYVLPSRGEGWGITYGEAMASGLPTIGTGYGGNTEFMTDENSILLDDIKMESITDMQAGYQPQYIGHQWASVNPESLAREMRKLFDNRDRGLSLGKIARADMMHKWSWESAGKIMINRINEIFDFA